MEFLGKDLYEMKYAIYISLLLMPAIGIAQVNNVVSTTGIAYTDGAPTFKPGARGSIVAVDTQSLDWYVSMDRNTSNWLKLGDRVQRIAGCSAPGYTPAKYQSDIVVNACTTPELYYYTGGSWACLNCTVSGSTNLSFTQLTDSTYQLNSSTGSDVIFKAGSNQTLSLSGSTLTLSSAGGGGSGLVGGDYSGQTISWNGVAWEPSWGNPYTFVTSGATITTDVNEILIGTISGNVTMGLPTCNVANDSKHFKFVRNGTDAFSVTIDPSGTQTFYDGTSVKINYGKLSIDCTCRYSGGVGVWFFDNF